MKEIKPQCRPEGIYSAKRACYELGICYKTLRRYRRMNLIIPLNPDNKFRSKYSGSAIIACWENLVKL